ncbi:MAG: hypothetical protein DLM67_14050 [Candidatus Nephthysia bennettiae]|uniref:Uncharacterized protein n=1 Tax=Candidatus Nephthysia bennettiae TaxID=3127016 RepID=A0A934K7N3_9BACT|nr:hypothetical protein [Candidatus Dormibacteraeota bacterium]MBJ7614791.1 hypothetical protein [Candidatus Dormibacteraeota bacterium]PZR93094.1 MAG: hypothetical protein DLM67_14050 [Candidatus Dormibacteraeota bacterium]
MKSKRKVVEFSLRHYSEIPLEVMANRVGQAIGVTFHESDEEDMPGVVTEVFGTNVALYDTRGLNNRVVFILTSWVTDMRFLDGPGGQGVELEGIDISEAVSDLLAVRRVGEWHPPAEAEVAAELAHATRRRKRFEREDA